MKINQNTLKEMVKIGIFQVSVKLKYENFRLTDIQTPIFCREFEGSITDF